MTTIVVTPPGAHLLELIYRALSRSAEVLCVTRREVRVPDMAPEYLLLEAEHPPECDGDAVYVLGAPAQGETPPFTAGPRSVAVIHSQNAPALAFAASRHLKTLTCGLSSRDTLTLSSLTDESAMICLQRPVATVGGGVVEPGEIPVRLRSPVERGELLTLAAVLLLCGDAGLLDEPL